MKPKTSLIAIVKVKAGCRILPARLAPMEFGQGFGVSVAGAWWVVGARPATAEAGRGIDVPPPPPGKAARDSPGPAGGSMMSGLGG